MKFSESLKDPTSHSKQFGDVQEAPLRDHVGQGVHPDMAQTSVQDIDVDRGQGMFSMQCRNCSEVV